MSAVEAEPFKFLLYPSFTEELMLPCAADAAVDHQDLLAAVRKNDHIAACRNHCVRSNISFRLLSYLQDRDGSRHGCRACCSTPNGHHVIHIQDVFCDHADVSCTGLYISAKPCLGCSV